MIEDWNSEKSQILRARWQCESAEAIPNRIQWFHEQVKEQLQKARHIVTAWSQLIPRHWENV